ncbi:MAG: cytochrome b [Cohaesibacteraceae bacterium]
MPNPTQKYKVPARLLHWTMAVLVLAMVPVGFLMLNDSIARELRNLMFIAHKNTGVLLLLLIVARLLYRWRNPPNLEPVRLPALQAFAAHATHVALYGLLLIMPLSGYIRVRAGGFPIEGLDALGVPPLVPRSEALADFAQAVHFYAGYGIAVFIALHVGAAAYHGLVCRDGIFSRMWPVFTREAN